MKLLGFLACLSLLGLVAANEQRAPDNFRMILSNYSKSDADNEIQSFLKYGCESLIEIRNDAKSNFSIQCKSADEAAKRVRIPPGRSYLFSVRPKVDGTSEYWCELSYEALWTRFDAYSEHRQPYLCPGKKVYRYSVRHDGIYADPERDDGVKIRALLKGHNEYFLWESFTDDGVPDGQLMKGFVDGGMCVDLPDNFDNKAGVVELCHHQCVFAYENRRCTGIVEKLQASEGCSFFVLSEISGTLSAIKGC